MNTALRRIRGALRNALLWGAAWFGATAALVTGANLFFGGRLDIVAMLYSGIIIGAVGALTGGTFSAYIAANFRRSRLDDLSPPRVALGGGLVATHPAFRDRKYRTYSTDFSMKVIREMTPARLAVERSETLSE